MVEQKKPRVGAYSGNERLDVRDFVEPDADTPEMQNLWFDEIPNDPDFKEEIEKRYNEYKTILGMSGDPDQFRATLVGESHIDVAWLWRFEQTRKKAAATFGKAVHHAKRFPGKFCFALSEPILLQWVKEDNPALFAEIQAAVKAGGIELVGGSYMEPDCMMPSAESFIRQRLYGMRFYRDHFGVLPEVEWFLDSFGYNWTLPQVLVKTGAKYFWTSKITWNMVTTFPFVFFNWEGVDGTRLFTANFHMAYGGITSWGRFEVGRRPLKEGATYGGNYERDYDDIADSVSETEINPNIGVFFGAGDGGHGPTHREVAEANALAECGPLFKWGRVHEYYREVAKWIPRFPVWQDELYLENHQGTFSVHAPVKYYNRFFENRLAATETLAALVCFATGEKKTYPEQELEALWQVTLKNQFHDVLPGSSIPEVYDDTFDDWQAGKNHISQLQVKLAANLQLPPGCQFVAFNNLPWDRQDRIFIPTDILAENVAIDANGYPPRATLELFGQNPQVLPAQPVAKEPPEWEDPRPAGWWVVADLKACSLTPGKITLRAPTELKSAVRVTAEPLCLKNNVTRVTLDPATGGITEMTSDLVPNCKNLLQGTGNNLTEAFKDKSREWPAWNLTPQYWKFPLEFSNTQEVAIEVRDQGPVFATIAVTRGVGKAHEKSSITQLYTVFAGRSELFCEYLADWHQQDVMLKVGIDTATGATQCTADIGGGAIIRSTQPRTPADKARHEKICHKFYDVSTPDLTWGLATLNEGKYAFDATGGRTRMTMLRSPEYPQPAAESWVHKERHARKAKDGTAPPTHSGLGPFRCRYAYLPHAGGALQLASGTPNPAVKRAAEEFNHPVILIPARASGEKKGGVAADGMPLLQVSAPNVLASTLKANEWEPESRSLVLHLMETCGQVAECEIALDSRLIAMVARAREVDLLERVGGSVPAREYPINGNKFHVALKKFEIKAIELVLK